MRRAAGDPPDAARGRALRPGAAFTDPRQVRLGMVVFDRDREMPGTVWGVDGLRVRVRRPSGLAWWVGYRRLRVGTAGDRRQLRALARFHVWHQRGR